MRESFLFAKKEFKKGSVNPYFHFILMLIKLKFGKKSLKTFYDDVLMSLNIENSTTFLRRLLRFHQATPPFFKNPYANKYLIRFYLFYRF